MNCPRCGNRNRASAKYCGHCGAVMPGGLIVKKPSPGAAALQLLDALGWFGYVVMDCPRCGNKNRTEARFCGYCGAPVAGVFEINKLGFAAAVLLLLGAAAWAGHTMFSRKPELNPPPAAAAASKPAEVSRSKLPDEHAGGGEAVRDQKNRQKLTFERQVVVREPVREAAVREADRQAAAREAAAREAATREANRQAAEVRAKTAHESAGDQIKAARKAVEDNIKAAHDAATKAMQPHR